MYGIVKIRFIPPRPNSVLYAFFRPGQSMLKFFVSGGQSTPITLFYALDGHRICADPQLFFLLINLQYMDGIRVNSSAVDSPNNSLIKTERKTRSQKMGGGGTISYTYRI